MSNRIRNIFFVVGLVAIVVMCFTFDVSFAELWEDLQRAGYWLVAILVLWAFLYLLNALSWRVIIAGSEGADDSPAADDGSTTAVGKVGFWYLYKLTITGFALNYATPVGLLGGEPYKILELTPRIGVQRATSSVVLFSMMHIFSHFWYWVTAIVTYIILAAVGNLTLGPGMAAVLVLMTLFCSLGIYLFVKGYENGMVVKLINLLSKIPGLRRWGRNFATNHADDLRKIDDQISQLHDQGKKEFYAALALEYVGRMLQSLEIYFVLRLFEVGGNGGFITFLYAFLILAFTSLLANLLFFFPLQLGGREGGFVMSTAQMGMTNSVGIFVSLICRVRELFWLAVGLILLKINNKEK